MDKQEFLSEVNSLVDRSSLQFRMNEILEGLRIKGVCNNVKVYRHLAFFDIVLSPGSSVRKLETKSREIALGIKSKTTPIVKVIPERGIVRLQVAMRQADSVSIESLYNGYVIPGSKKSMLPIILGESDKGEKLVVDFSKNPHTLIAGGTGSGKSVLLHNIIANIIYLQVNNARAIDLYLVDPKQVEFVSYLGDSFKPYVCDVINDYESTVDLLEHLERVMEDRYRIMKDNGFRSLDEVPRGFSQIVVVIDEVADLMIQDKKIKRFEKSVVRLAQKARAAGIHIIMATQRPSADVITGLIKANFPARIACKTASKTDSQVILDSPGAENLMGRGDAVLNNMENDKTRFQVAFSDPKKTEQSLMFFKSVA